MHSYEMVKQEFMKRWISGLRTCNSSLKPMSVSERKKAIKLSADVAIAAARSGATIWSRALLSAAAGNSSHKLLVRRILQKYRYYYRPKNVIGTTKSVSRTIQCVRNGGKMKKRCVLKRTEVLKSIVPGGELMDGHCLIQETLDYIVYLQAQVDVMRSVTVDR